MASRTRPIAPACNFKVQVQSLGLMAVLMCETVWLLQIPKPALLKGVGMSPGAGPVAGGNGYSRGGSVEYEGPSGYASGGGQGMPEGGASQYMGGGELWLPAWHLIA